MQALQSEHITKLEQARVARLATADKDGNPHCVPVCFCHWEGRLFIALDEKPKRVGVKQLKRVRNIEENPQATLLVDHYDEDWQQLWFLMIESRASVEIIPERARQRLMEKYPQYRFQTLEQAIVLEPQRCVAWQY